MELASIFKTMPASLFLPGILSRFNSPPLTSITHFFLLILRAIFPIIAYRIALHSKLLIVPWLVRLFWSYFKPWLLVNNTGKIQLMLFFKYREKGVSILLTPQHCLSVLYSLPIIWHDSALLGVSLFCRVVVAFGHRRRRLLPILQFTHETPNSSNWLPG